jgi:hypothetical protein
LLQSPLSLKTLGEYAFDSGTYVQFTAVFANGSTTGGAPAASGIPTYAGTLVTSDILPSGLNAGEIRNDGGLTGAVVE